MLLLLQDIRSDICTTGESILFADIIPYINCSLASSWFLKATTKGTSNSTINLVDSHIPISLPLFLAIMPAWIHSASLLLTCSYNKPG